MTPRIRQALNTPVSPGAALNAWQQAEEKRFDKPRGGWSWSITAPGFKSLRLTLSRKL